MDGNEKAREKLEAKHRTTFRFSVPNGHFSIGLVKQKMRNINGWIRKLNMTGSGMNATDMSLVFQYVVFKLNSVPYGLRNIHTYSQAQVQEARSQKELIAFIRAGDWLMFSAPSGLDFYERQTKQ